MEIPKIYYALTWNPNPKSFINNEEYEIDLFKEHLQYIEYISKYVKFIVPEFSDNYKLHYHGLAEVQSDTEFVQYYNKLKKLKRRGFILNKKILTEAGLQKWILYCGKTWSRTRTILQNKIEDHKLLSFGNLNDGLIKITPEQKYDRIFDQMEVIHEITEDPVEGMSLTF